MRTEGRDCSLVIARNLRAELMPHKGSDGGTDVVVLNECCEWMTEPIVGHWMRVDGECCDWNHDLQKHDLQRAL